ncbi:MAG TPA: hypothetical protein VKT78_19840 [Fimbriimonadaceae bacterium]|nr:hypothetical protein [Fimbriimonadaceae bacterium]
MNASQVEACLREVICPEYRNLGINPDELKPVGAGHEWYGLATGGPADARVQVIIGLYQVEPRRFCTTLSSLCLGLEHAQRAIARKQGRPDDFWTQKQHRDLALARLGMSGLCDMRSLEVAKWPDVRE